MPCRERSDYGFARRKDKAGAKEDASPASHAPAGAQTEPGSRSVSLRSKGRPSERFEVWSSHAARQTESERTKGSPRRSGNMRAPRTWQAPRNTDMASASPLEPARTIDDSIEVIKA